MKSRWQSLERVLELYISYRHNWPIQSILSQNAGASRTGYGGLPYLYQIFGEVGMALDRLEQKQKDAILEVFKMSMVRDHHRRQWSLMEEYANKAARAGNPGAAENFEKEAKRARESGDDQARNVYNKRKVVAFATGMNDLESDLLSRESYAAAIAKDKEGCKPLAEAIEKMSKAIEEKT